jgi:hypothetical protein
MIELGEHGAMQTMILRVAQIAVKPALSNNA